MEPQLVLYSYRWRSKEKLFEISALIDYSKLVLEDCFAEMRVTRFKRFLLSLRFFLNLIF